MSSVTSPNQPMVVLLVTLLKGSSSQSQLMGISSLLPGDHQFFLGMLWNIILLNYTLYFFAILTVSSLP